MIRILFFARLRDETGESELALCLPAEVRTVSQLTRYLIGERPAWSGILDGRSVLVAVNHNFAQSETPVEDGDEIAYFPPVTGG